MAAGDQLLLKLGVDTAPFRQAMDAIRAGLGSLQSVASNLTGDAGKAAADLGSALSDITQSMQANVQASRDSLAAEKEKLGAVKEGGDAYSKQAQAAGAVGDATRGNLEAEKLRRSEIQSATAELQRQTAEHRAMTAEIQKQMAEIRKARMEQKGEGGGGKEGERGIASQLLGQVTKGVLGSGLAGGVAGGVLAGEGIAAAIESVGELIEKFKELLNESSELTVVEDTFEKLAKGAGADANKMLAEMQERTSGLVTRFQLLQVANTALRSPLGINPEQLAQLMGDVTKLALAAGKSVPEAMDRMKEGLERGRLQTIATATGISSLELMVNDVPPTLNRAQRAAYELSYALDKVHMEASKISEVDNVTDVITRLGVAAKDTFLEFGRGIIKSGGMEQLINMMDGVAGKLRELQNNAEKFGERIGDAFGAIVPIFRVIELTVKDTKDIIVDALSSIQQLFGVMDDGNQAHSVIVGLSDAFMGLGIVIDASLKMVKALFDTVISGAKPVIDTISLMIGGEMQKGKPVQSWSDTWKKLQQIQQESNQWPDTVKKTWSKGFDDFLNEAKQRMVSTNEMIGNLTAARDETGRPIKKGPFDNDENLKNQEKLLQDQRQGLQDQLKIELDSNQSRLAAHQLFIEQERQSDTEAYERAQESLKAHLQRERELEEMHYTATRDKAIADYVSKTHELQGQSTIVESRRKLGVITPQEATQEQANIQKQMQAEVETLQKALLSAAQERTKTLGDITKQEAQDEVATEAKKVENILALEQKQTQGRIQEMQLQQKAAEEAVRTDQALNEKKFGQGQLNPDQYYQKQTANITKLHDITVASDASIAAARIAQIQQEIDSYEKLAQIKKQSGQSDEAEMGKAQQAEQQRTNLRQQLRDQLAAADQKQKDDQSKLDEDQDQKRLQYLKQFQNQQQALEAQLTARQQYGSASGAPTETQTIQNILKNLSAEGQASIYALNQMNQEGHAFSDTWWEIYQRSQQTINSMQDYIVKLMQARSVAASIGSLFEQMGSQLLEAIPSKWGQNFVQAITSGGKALSEAPQRGQAIANAFGGKQAEDPVIAKLQDAASKVFTAAQNAAGTLAQTFNVVTAAATKAAGAMDQLSSKPSSGSQIITGGANGAISLDQIKLGAEIAAAAPGTASPAATGAGTGSSSSNPSGGGLANTVQNWTKGIVAATSAVADFASTILHAKNAASGAAGGLLSGSGAGTSIGSGIAGQLGGIVGGAAGAVLGTITGLIAGKKNQQIQNTIQNFTTQMQDIMQSYALNNNNLQQTIIQLMALKGALESEQNEQKKGKGSQAFTQQIDQINQQIMQLQAQQNNIIVNMNEQLAVLAAPQGAQQYLTTLQQILQQYDQFAGAAQNTDQLTEANQYLVASLQNYAVTLDNQLEQADQTAIQNALQLNDLYNERIELVNQMNTQIEGVLSAGVATRTPTRAMTAGQQIEQIEYTGQNQLDQLNEQISADQYSVQAQQQIFQLASTRIGLEMQLLQLQNAQTDLQTANINALSQLLGALQTGNYNSLATLLGSMQGYSNPTTGTTNTGLTPQQLAALIALMTGGNGSVPAQGGAQALQSIFASAYQQYAALGFGQYKGQNL